VVDRSCSHDSAPDSRNAPKIDDGSRAAIARRVPEYAPLLAHEPEPQSIGEQLAGKLVGVEPEGDGINATYSVFGGDSGSCPTSAGVSSGVGYELAHESFVVFECDNALVLIARSRLLELDALLDQPLYPEANRAGQNREGSYSDLPTALPSAASIRPREKGEDASRVTLFVTEVEVIGRGIVKVYRALDEPEAENAGVEVEIALGVTGYGGDVVDTGSAETHRADSCLAFLRDLGLACVRTGVAVALLCKGFGTLFLLSSGCHNISNLDPFLKATAMPFAEALM
jgi:hypothetical protein